MIGKAEQLMYLHIETFGGVRGGGVGYHISDLRPYLGLVWGIWAATPPRAFSRLALRGPPKPGKIMASSSEVTLD